MNISNMYFTIRETLCGNNSFKNEIFDALALITDILNDWFETGEYSRDFEYLLHLLRDDYCFSGTIYRGITLLKEHFHIHCNNEYQSFSLDKKVAMDFALNQKVSFDGAIQEDRSEEEITPILLELNGQNIGINLFSFAQDLSKISEGLTLDEDLKFCIDSILHYPLTEKEVLVSPHTFRTHFNQILIHDDCFESHS